jgi:hypothetical protein
MYVKRNNGIVSVICSIYLSYQSHHFSWLAFAENEKVVLKYLLWKHNEFSVVFCS